MRYRVTCLTPTLVGDGQRLSPIDYMVWKDHVNVLDQRRIFKLLAKGPRLDGYLAQLKKADRLDFASWGGFAQNFAGRRIPFEHASSIPVWERARAEHLFIPTFAASHHRPVSTRDGGKRRAAHRRGVRSLDRSNSARSLRAPRQRAPASESRPRGSRTFRERKRLFGGRFHGRGIHSDAGLPAARLDAGRARPRQVRTGMEVGARIVGRAAHRRKHAGIRRDGSRPGRRSKAHGRNSPTRIAPSFSNPRTATPPRNSPSTSSTPTPAASRAWQPQSKRWKPVSTEISHYACLLSIGWGGGMSSKVAYLDTENEAFRRILRQFPFYQRAIQTGLPFPKTRRVIFEGSQPASLPGWVGAWKSDPSRALSSLVLYCSTEKPFALTGLRGTIVDRGTQ